MEDFPVPDDHSVKLKEIEKKDKYLDLERELNKTVKHESDVYTSCNWCSWYSHQRIGTKTGGLGNDRTSRDHPNYYIIEIGQNTEEIPGDLRGFAVIQTHIFFRFFLFLLFLFF